MIIRIKEKIKSIIKKFLLRSSSVCDNQMASDDGDTILKLEIQPYSIEAENESVSLENNESQNNLLDELSECERGRLSELKDHTIDEISEVDNLVDKEVGMVQQQYSVEPIHESNVFEDLDSEVSLKDEITKREDVPHSAKKEVSGPQFQIESQAEIFTKEKAKEQKTKYDIKISEISGVSNRTLNVLSAQNVFTISQLLLLAQEQDLSKIRRIGTKTLAEINKIIYEFKQDMIHITENVAIFETGKKIDDSLTIKELFAENKFNLFVQYCSRNNIVSIDDLSDFDFSVLHSVSGIGQGKINEIIARCNEIFSNKGLSSKIDVCNPFFKKIHEDLKCLDIDFLSVFDIKQIQCNKLREAGFQTVGDLEGITESYLSKIVSNRNIDRYKKFADKIQLNIIELFEVFLSEKITQRDYKWVIERAEGCTLQDIGDRFDLTREAIRQKEKNVIDELSYFMIPVVNKLIKRNRFITVQDIIDIYNNEDIDKILIYWCKNSNHLHYLDFADVFLPLEFDINKIESELLKLADDFVGDGVSLSEHVDDLISMLQDRDYYFLDSNSFLDFMFSKGYRQYKDFIFKGSQSNGLLYARIVAERFPNGIKINDPTDLKHLRTYMLEDYGIEAPTSDRAVVSRLSNNLVLCGRGLYKSEKNIQVQQELLDELKLEIDKRPEDKLYYSELFAKYQGKIRMMSSIDNYHYLHGVLKLYFSQFYDFSNRDYFKKIGAGYISGGLGERIRKIIIKNNRSVLKKEVLKEIPGVSDIVFANLFIKDENLFLWDYNEFSSLEILLLSDEDKKFLQETIIKIMDNTSGYCSSNLLYSEVLEQRPDIITNNRMTKGLNLYYVCEKLFGNIFDFRRPHICKKGLLDSMSVKTVALHMLNDPICLYYSDYLALVERLKWSGVTCSAVFNEIEKDYVRVSKDMYIKYDSFSVSQRNLEIIEECLKKSINKGFASLWTIDFDKYPEFELDFDKYPELELKFDSKWNGFLLHSIIIKYLHDFKVIEGARSNSRNYERGIVLEKNSPINNYVDLVIWLIQQQGDNKIKENKLLSLLVFNGLARDVIPKELRSSNKISIENEYFCISRECELDSV